MVHISNFRKVKRVEDVITVFCKVSQQIPVKLLLVGDGPERSTMEKMKKEGFRNMLNSQFIKHTNICVDSFLNGDLNNLFKSTKKLSQVVFENFKPMIPKEFHNLWKKGIDNGYRL